jgi:DNA-binding transcriptional LysR family regulator
MSTVLNSSARVVRTGGLGGQASLLSTIGAWCLALLWIMPLLYAFWARHPSFRVRDQVVADRTTNT